MIITEREVLKSTESTDDKLILNSNRSENANESNKNF